MSDQILLIGTKRWEQTLRRNWNVLRLAKGRDARALADQQRFEVIIVDAASMHTTGERICRQLRTQFPDSTIIHLLAAPLPDRRKAADVTMVSPLTARKLTGVVSRILSDDPLDTIRCGPFVLNRTTRILSARGQDVQLNPKLSALIALFMLNPNKALPRAAIMKRVWKTDYLGDTRTLYVHIRHARQLLEEDPQAPKYLKTIRGSGYRFEIETQK